MVFFDLMSCHLQSVPGLPRRAAPGTRKPLNRGILHSPVKARTNELAQICCAPAGKNVAQIFRGASPPLYCHRKRRKDFSIAALQIIAVQLAINRNQATDVHIVKVCFDFPCGHSSVVPEVVRRWTPNILNLADFRTPVHKELVLIAADRQRFKRATETTSSGISFSAAA